MSEHNEQLPLTRRERRLREMAETGALDLSEVSEASAEGSAKASGSVPADVGDEIEISPVNEDGTPRSRREMRQLREAARAAARPTAETETGEAERTETATPEAAAPEATLAESSAPEDIDAETSGLAQEEPDERPSEGMLEDVPAPVSADTHAPAVPDFDTLIAPPTEPFTVDELRDASQSSVAEILSENATGEAEVEDAVQAGDETVVEIETEAPAASEEEAAVGKAKRRFPWKRNKGGEDAAVVAPPVDASESEGPVSDASPAEPALSEAEPVAETIVIDEVEAVEVASETRTTTAEADDAAVLEDLSVDAEIVEATPSDAPIIPEASEDAAAGAEEATSVVDDESKDDSGSPSEYSFPDIVPPEEWRSVFDDPSSRIAPSAAQGAQSDGDFDDLISRAVAQEGASGASNTSALILPTMPEDTGGLSGPLGGTGELYLTGSIELPKSLGETGGHSALHDSIEMDPIVGHEAAEAHVTADHGPAPVSARHAVSARVPSSIPVVAKPTRERSKLPLVLSLTGGGLLVAVVALGVWGASNGMFG